MTAQFKPGDRVLREVVIDRDPGGADVLVQSSSVNGSWTAWVSRESIIAPPTPAAHLRAAAGVMDTGDAHDKMVAEGLRNKATHLEAAAAPKPEPTLREALEEAITDLSNTLSNIQVDLAKGNARWEGVPERLRPRIDSYREALAREVAK